ncbi:MAG: class I SAM-dependent methyltransferase, partial [Myxococcales bacterium]|nr:class I SAM-dependent methyltransferase [Myxococcales bacterium]
IAAHYDLGNDFFELFLDETMTYSCGVFERPEASMAEASRAKIDRLCRKLRLGPGDHLLEIGTGWGAFAIHAARKYGCRVTTTTISREQHAWAARKVREAGLEDRVTLLLSDYRDLTGTYDKLVSVEMIEAVGAAYVPGFLAKCASLLRPEGLMALQAITVREQSYAAHLGTVDFIKRYIFPGGELVGLGALCDAVGRATDLRVEHVEDLSPHYAETLRRWRERFEKNRAAIADLGYPERFLRMWEYYLTYCEGGFAERYVGGAQIVLAKPLARPASLLGPIAEGAV